MSGVQTVALAGLGGYGDIYLRTLLAPGTSSRLSFIGGIDPRPEGCARLAELEQGKIPIFASLDEFFAGHRADLVILSTPLQLHCEQAVSVLSHGSNVLCEKPLGSHPDQTRQMIEARDRAELQLAIGYQWSFSPTIQNLKRDIAAGRFGPPKRLRSRVYWPRDEKYYTRSSWAGRQFDQQGRPVFDSPANNACAHFLHNMFYVLGTTPQSSDWPAVVEAELYRAHDIENYDTIALRCRTRGGVEILFFTSHATKAQRDLIFQYEFENAIIHYGGKYGDRVVAELIDGKRVDYGAPTAADSVQKLFDVLQSIRDRQPVICGPEAAGAQTACIFAAQQSTPAIVPFPSDQIVVEGDTGQRRTHVKNLDKDLDRCYNEAVLPGDIGIPWAKRAAQIGADGPIDRVQEMASIAHK
jgi:predicted dehydrogenase